MLKESKADIFVDPVLHTACALDIKHHCAAIPPGKGRREYTRTAALLKKKFFGGGPPEQFRSRSSAALSSIILLHLLQMS